ncbi:MAG: hypothetical protein ACI8XM_000478 [Haloarculaceae archaeon]|jgi:hypothetical protein
MEWRCEWCGKPHEENDPPCDNCGHGTFEEAVVRQTDPNEGAGPDETVVWVCTECGRTHTKHAPPCSRCQNNKLVREVQSVDESELTAPGYLDLLTPKYLAGFVLVLGLAAVFVLGVTGIVYVPGLSPGLPSVSDVPGEADTASGLSLSDVEASYLAGLNDRRADAGLVALERTEDIDAVAAFANQRIVKADYADGQPPDQQTMSDAFPGECRSDGVVPSFVRLEAGSGTDVADSEDALAQALIERRVSDGIGEEGRSITGLDVHVAPDGVTYLTQFTC